MSQKTTAMCQFGRCGIMPSVSVVIPAYNAADFITDAYRSVVDQTIDDWELIFVNDGSRDDTLAIIESLATADQRIKVINLALNRGPARARNAAFAVARGDWIALLDADDRYSRDRLRVLTGAAKQTEADIVLDNLYVVDPLLKRVAFLAFEPPTQDLTILAFADFLRNLQSNTLFDFGYLKPIIRRRWLVSTDIKYQEQLRLGEDAMLLLDCYARRAKVVLVSKPYYYYTFQYSHASRAVSPTTNTEANYDPLLAATEHFLEKHRSKQSRPERRLLVSACETLRETITATALQHCIERCDIVGSFRCLRHPVRLSRGLYFRRRRSILFQRRANNFMKIKAA
jgi:succinoglycan biosynthesis protein ExoO